MTDIRPFPWKAIVNLEVSGNDDGLVVTRAMNDYFAVAKHLQRENIELRNEIEQLREELEFFRHRVEFLTRRGP